MPLRITLPMPDVAIRIEHKFKGFSFSLYRPKIVKAGPEAFDSGDADEPHVIFFNGKYLMYYTGYDGTYWTICMAESSSPEGPWIKKGKVLGGPPNYKPEAVLVYNGKIYLYALNEGPSPAIYTGKLFTSTDGVNFTDEGVVISPDSYDVGDDGALHPVAAWYDEDLGKFYLLYIAWIAKYNPMFHPRNLYLAESSDGISFSKLGSLVRDAVHGVICPEGDIIKIGDRYYYLADISNLSSLFYISFRKPYAVTFHKYRELDYLRRDPETYGLFGSRYDDFFPILVDNELLLYTGEPVSPSDIHLFKSNYRLSEITHEPVNPLKEVHPVSLPLLRGYSISANETKQVLLFKLPYRYASITVDDDQAATVNIYSDPDGRGDWYLLDSRGFTGAFTYTWDIETRTTYIIVEVVQGGTGGTLNVKGVLSP